jgi:glycosyltransferase involved in cell wall biosynthesis
MKISLVLPTLGRKIALLQFMDSLIVTNSQLSSDDSLELIVVDQNPPDFGLKVLVEKYNEYYSVSYIHSEIKGLSFNRNIGLKLARGDTICFPDDDCLYYPDTLKAVVQFFNLNHEVDAVLGRIYDRQSKKNIIKAWPEQKKVINSLNFYLLSSSITIFVRKSAVLFFDESLGVGAKYGSCEDPDFLYRILKNHSVCYTPAIDVWHPIPDMSAISLNKVESYSSGFGYFIRKDISIVKIILLFMLLGKKVAQYVFTKKRFAKGYFNAFYKGLISGLFKKYD